MKIFIQISYKGTSFSGWQIQQNANSVQQEIERSFTIIFNQPIRITGSSRTDTGVHAQCQFAHTEIPDGSGLEKLKFKLNSLLPPDISIDRILAVPEHAHSRFDAISRTYEYRITKCKNPFLKDLTYSFGMDLDIGKMNVAAEELLKHNDFQSFSKVKTDVNNYLCEITDACWEWKDSVLIFTVTSNRFLRGMVRALVGTLIEVGLQKISVEQFVEIIRSKDRKKAGRAVPACGLFLTEVKYPDGYFEYS